MGSVRVSPGMLETKVMVAPNSPKPRAKASMAPVKMPGNISGRLTVANTQSGGAPSVRAAASSFTSTLSSERRMARTIRGKAITAEATAAPRQVKATVMPNQS